jgi:hypothetical protein
MSHQPPEEETCHEFKPLPDRTPEEQVKALTQIVHQMSQNCFEARLELNDLREQRAEVDAELRYLRGIVDAEGRANYKKITSN